MGLVFSSIFVWADTVWGLVDDAVGLVVLFVASFFFFSSRRRHTRCLSDWSSDVCSSDLTARVVEHLPVLAGDRARQLVSVSADQLTELEQQVHAPAQRRRTPRLRGIDREIGRASCRERVWSGVDDVSLEGRSVGVSAVAH